MTDRTPSAKDDVLDAAAPLFAATQDIEALSAGHDRLPDALGQFTGIAICVG